ncbi:MAG: hypothetical protein ABSG04_00735 [Verrucomicrobiota bacterium]
MNKATARSCALALAAIFVLTEGRVPGSAAALPAQDIPPSAPAPAGSASRLVGDLGEPARLDFEGLHTFTADAVRSGLLNNIDFLADSHPAAPLNDYLRTLRDKVLTGYQAAGFPEAQVNMSFDSEKGRILVKVNEGPRFQQGGIRVTGAGTIPVELLRRRLTQVPPSLDPNHQSISERLEAIRSDTQNTPSSTSNSPVWVPGKPAPFDPLSLNVITNGLDQALQDLGYFFARTRVKVVPDTNDQTAYLLIDVQEEGPSGLIDQIVLTGLKNNQRDAVLKYLALKPGLPLNRPLVIRTEDLLWRSARFQDFKVTPEIVPDGRQVNLKIALTEFETVPPLQQGLSREARALLRLCDWLSETQFPSQDIVLDLASENNPIPWFNGTAIRFILSQQGALLMVGKEALGKNAPPLCAWIATPDTLGFFDFAHHSKFTVALTNSSPVFTAFLNVLPNPDPAAASRFTMSFGGGLESSEDEDTKSRTNAPPPFALKRMLAPVVFAGQAYYEKAAFHFSFDNGLMTMTNEDCCLTIEEKSGKLVKLSLPGKDQQVSSDSRAFDKALAQFARLSAADPNQLDAKDLLGSFLGFLLQEAVFVSPSWSSNSTVPPDEQRRRAADAIQKITARHPFAPLKEMTPRQLPAKDAEPFNVPFTPGDSAVQTALSAFLPIIFRYGEGLFPKGSWPWLVLRETALSLADRGKYTDQVVQDIFQSDQTGPLGFEVNARLMNLANSPATIQFASKGLTRLSAADFRRDYSLLLDGDCVLQQCFANLAQGLASLDDGEVGALAGLLSPDNAALLRRSVQLLRQRGDKSLAETLSPVLNELWDTRLKKLIENDLRKLANPPATNPPPIHVPAKA